MDLVISRSAESILNVTPVDDSSIISDHYTVCVKLKAFSNLKKTLDCLLFYLILLVTYKSFSTCITQNYLVNLINMHHLNRTWLPSALLPHGSVTDQTGEKNSPSTWEEMAKDGGPEDRIRFIEQNCIVN